MRTSLFIANLTLLFFIEPVSALDAQTLFSQQCSQCHGATLRGSAHGTSLKGQIFKDTWATQNWQALASLSSTTMPPWRTGQAEYHRACGVGQVHLHQ